MYNLILNTLGLAALVSILVLISMPKPMTPQEKQHNTKTVIKSFVISTLIIFTVMYITNGNGTGEGKSCTTEGAKIDMMKHMIQGEPDF